MSLDNIKNSIPEYAKDIKLNLSSLAQEEILNTQQLWGTFLASALACKNSFVIEQIHQSAKEHLTEQALTAAKSASAIMGMNNIYYRFLGLVGDPSYASMPAKLRMNVIANPGIEKSDFELWSLAVSAINGCKGCLAAHEKQLIDHGVSKEQIQAAVRIASVVHAVSAICDSESALGSEISEAA
jgi:alkyl hydroperoxide reductase subunit D